MSSEIFLKPALRLQFTHRAPNARPLENMVSLRGDERSEDPEKITQDAASFRGIPGPSSVAYIKR